MYKSKSLENEYLRRREHYFNVLEKSGLIYNEDEIKSLVIKHLKDNNSLPIQKLNRINTYVFIPIRSGHLNLVYDLYELGNVKIFDYHQYNISIDSLRKADTKSFNLKKLINDLFYEDFKKASKDVKFDWIFIYASGYEISAHTLRKIKEEFSIPIVSLCMDDKQSWTGPFMGDHRAGQIDLANVVDLAITTSKETTMWYYAEGGRAIYLPEGYSINKYHRLDNISKNNEISFVGNNYGSRRNLMADLNSFNIYPNCYGSGWRNGWVEDDNEVFNNSYINLGNGGIGYSEELTNVKGRDFDIPGSGGGLYITSYNKDISTSFIIGSEIVCYKNTIELVELLRYYLNNKKEAQLISNAAYLRCQKEHRWLHRYREILKIIQLI
jgi:hypothetical protein